MAKSLTTKKDKGKEKTAPKQRGRKPTPLTPYEGPNLGLGEEKIEEIEVDKLNLEDETFQIRFSSEPDKSLLESVKTHGIQIPLIARPHPKKKESYQLICGFRRATAAKQAGLKKVPVVVRQLNDEAAHIQAYTENEYRKTLKDLDRAHAIRKLRDADKTTGQIAALFRLSERQIQRLQKLFEYPDVLKKAIDDDKITTTLAMTLLQAQNKHGEEFDLKEWLKTAVESGSVDKLKKALKEAFPQERERGALIHRRDNGDTITFSMKAIKEAEPEKKAAALKELEGLMKELGKR